MAQHQGGDGELAGQIVVFSSLLSMFTLFGIIFLLKTLAFL
jgi:predicted permease